MYINLKARSLTKTYLRFNLTIAVHISCPMKFCHTCSEKCSELKSQLLPFIQITLITMQITLQVMLYLVYTVGINYCAINNICVRRSIS